MGLIGGSKRNDIIRTSLHYIILIYKPEIAQKAAFCALVGLCGVPCDVPSTTIYNSRMAYMRS